MFFLRVGHGWYFWRYEEHSDNTCPIDPQHGGGVIAGLFILRKGSWLKKISDSINDDARQISQTA